MWKESRAGTSFGQQSDLAYENQKEAELTNIPTPPTTDDAPLDDTKDAGAQQIRGQEQPIPATTAVAMSSAPILLRKPCQYHSSGSAVSDQACEEG